MTVRSVRPKVLHHLRRLKCGARHTATATDATFAPLLKLKENNPVSRPNTAAATTTALVPVVDFTNTKTLFASLSSWQLAKSCVILKASSIESLADFGTVVWKHDLMKQRLVRTLVLSVTERTFFDHFCAGKDLAAATLTVRKLWKLGIKSMLDYALEDAKTNGSCDRNTQEFIRTINSSDDNPGVGFVAVKMTAICPKELLHRVSDLLRWEYKNSSMNLPWKLKTLPILCDSSPLYHTMTEPQPLTPEEEHNLQLANGRLSKLCQNSLDANLPLFFDAEETEIQPAIDYLTYSAVLKYGRVPGQRPLIFNTIQAYLVDSKERLENTMAAAEKLGIPLGIKLVRGAYIEKERADAIKAGFRPPIHPSIDHTHANYDECAEFLLTKIRQCTAAAVIATHNTESGEKAAMKAVNLGIDRQSHCLHFAQLYGMAEAMSFGLKDAGFNVGKYCPFGPVDQTMAYLLRRAEENKCVLGASSNDIKLMRDELTRRRKELLRLKS